MALPVYDQPGWIYDQPAQTYDSGTECIATYDFPGWTYDQPNAFYDDCGLGDGRTYQHLQMRAFIFKSNDLQMRGNLSRRQGWPIPPSDDPGIDQFTATQLFMRARITGAIQSSQSFQMRGRIRFITNRDLEMRARIVNASHLSMKANIIGRYSSSKIVVYFKVRQAQSAKIRVSFFVPGLASRQSLQCRASIIKRWDGRIPVRFLVVNPNGSQTQTVSGSSTGRTQQTLVMRAGIVRL